VHCATGRINAAWRAAVGMPEICPQGFTARVLPHGAAPVIDAAEIRRRLAAMRQTCHTCGEKAACEGNLLRKGRGGPCEQKRHLRNGGTYTCPLGRF